MKTSPRWWTPAVLLLGPSAAFAADPHGLLTLVVGVPLMLVASVVLGILALLPARRPLQVIATVLFVPALFYGLYVALDAVTLFGTLGSENAMIGFAFFGLMALACLLFWRVLHRRTG